MTVFYNENSPPYFKYIDITLGILCCLLFLIATPANLIVTRFYYNKWDTNTGKLHVLMCTFYFVETLLHPLIMTYNFLKSGSKTDVPQPLLVISCTVAGFGMNIGANTLTVLSATRLYSLSFPLHQLSKRRVMSFEILAVIFGIHQTFNMVWESKLPDRFEFNFDNEKQFIKIKF